jgi:predicted metal-dependent hydrolase
MLRNWRKTLKSAPSGEITTDGVTIAITRKRIKNFYLRIDRRQGHVRMSVPQHASDDEVRSVVARRIDWIKRQQARAAATPPVVRLRYSSGETHFFLGELLRLEVVESSCRGSKVDRDGDTLTLTIRRRSRFDQRERAVCDWYRGELQSLIPALVAKWEPVMGLRVAESKVKRMRTRWGTCNIRARRIWLNLELAKYLPECLEYVVVHEMVHLLERSHNARFKSLMDRFLPDWRERKRTLGAGLDGNYNQEDGRDDQDDLCD